MAEGEGLASTPDSLLSASGAGWLGSGAEGDLDEIEAGVKEYLL